jgi:hypothetical protein
VGKEPIPTMGVPVPSRLGMDLSVGRGTGTTVSGSLTREKEAATSTAGWQLLLFPLSSRFQTGGE